jgi:hypothetical protein
MTAVFFRALSCNPENDLARFEQKRNLSDDKDRFSIGAVHYRSAEGGKQHVRQAEANPSSPK